MRHRGEQDKGGRRDADLDVEGRARRRDQRFGGLVVIEVADAQWLLERLDAGHCLRRDEHEQALDGMQCASPRIVQPQRAVGDGRFIVEWDNVLNGEDDQNCPDCITETFQMILYDPDIYTTATGDGDIVFQYKEIHDIDQNGNYSTIGIESPDQEDGVQYLFSSIPGPGSYWELNENGYYGNLAIKFTTGSSCAYLDVNGDSVVNIVDVIDIVNIVLGSTDPDSTACAADINSDSIINVIDIIDLVNYILQ